MHLLKPFKYVNKITDIDSHLLKVLKVKAILLDIDNTLAFHGREDLFDGVLEWIKNLKMNNYRLVLISNNSHERVETFAKKVGLEFITEAKKPLPYGFNVAKNLLNLKSEQILVIGDQIFTDVLGANLAGMRSILLEPIDCNEPIFIKFKRILEKPFRIKLK